MIFTFVFVVRVGNVCGVDVVVVVVNAICMKVGVGIGLIIIRGVVASVEVIRKDMLVRNRGGTRQKRGRAGFAKSTNSGPLSGALKRVMKTLRRLVENAGSDTTNENLFGARDLQVLPEGRRGLDLMFEVMDELLEVVDAEDVEVLLALQTRKKLCSPHTQPLPEVVQVAFVEYCLVCFFFALLL